MSLTSTQESGSSLRAHQGFHLHPFAFEALCLLGGLAQKPDAVAEGLEVLLFQVVAVRNHHQGGVGEG